MTIDNESRILLFYPAVHASLAEHLKKKIEASAASICKIQVLLQPDDAPLPASAADQIQACVVLFTPALNQNAHLFDLIKAISYQRSLERFLVLPKENSTGKIPFPALLHPLRAQQHQIIGYSRNTEGKLTLEAFEEAFLKTFNERLDKLCLGKENQAPEDPQGLFKAVDQAWNSPGRNIVLISVLILIGLIFGVYAGFPQFADAINDEIAASILGFEVPEFGPAWVDEAFFRLNADQWEETHRYLGQDPLMVDFSEDGLSLRAITSLEQAIYYLDYLETFPIESLQGFEVSFMIETLPDGEGESEVSYQLALAENPETLCGCRLILKDREVVMECYLEEPDQRMVLAGPASISLNETHTLTMVFLPESYVFRFFMDDVYFGRMPIASVEDWLAQSLTASIQVEGKNLDQNAFSLSLDHVKIFQQDVPVINE
jgi:hypothetical protein